MRLESPELFAPQPLGLREPAYQVRHRLNSQGVDPYAGVEQRMGFRDNAAFPQGAQVSAHRRPWQTDRAGQFAGGAGTAAQQFHHRSSMRIGEGGERAVDRRRPHAWPLIFSPEAAAIWSNVNCLVVWPTVQM